MTLQRLSLFVALATSVSLSAQIVMTGPGTGTAAVVKVFENESEVNSLTAFNPFTGGVTVAYGDINADSVPDLITATSTASSRVTVFSGTTNAVRADFFAFGAGYSGGIYVAGGDVNGDGFDDVIVGAASGAPLVKVFDGNTEDEIISFLAFAQSFTGGVRVASADYDGDKRSDIIVGAGPGAAPQVRVFAADDGADLWTFSALGQSNFTGGVYVAAADLTGDGVTEIVVGADAGGLAEVAVYNGASRTLEQNVIAFDGYSGGVRVAVVKNDADATPYIVAATGANRAAEVRVFDWPMSSFDVFFPYGNLLTGAYVAGYDTRPTASIISNDDLCGQGDAAFIHIALTGTAPWSLTWSDGVTQTGIVSATHFRQISSAGTYTLTNVTDRHHAHGRTEGSATVSSGTPPVFTQQPVGEQTITAGNTVTLTAAAGAGVTYQWFKGISPSGTPISGATSASYSSQPVQSTFYYVVASNQVCSSTSQSAHVTVQPTRPINVVATAVSSSTVNVTWSAAAGAATYEVYRRTGTGAYTLATTTAATSFSDSGRSGGTTHLYKVRSISSEGLASVDSTPDIATTIVLTDSALTAGVTKMKAAHITELRAAVNAARAAAGLSSVTFTDSPLAAGTKVKAAHISELRAALDPARAALGLFAISYVDPSLTAGSTVVKAVHVNQLRAGAL